MLLLRQLDVQTPKLAGSSKPLQRKRQGCQQASSSTLSLSHLCTKLDAREPLAAAWLNLSLPARLLQMGPMAEKQFCPRDLLVPMVRLYEPELRPWGARAPPQKTSYGPNPASLSHLFCTELQSCRALAPTPCSYHRASP